MKPFTQQFHLKAALLLRLAESRSLRVFVEFDVPAERQPPVERTVVNDKDPACVNHEDGNGEIDLLVNVRHVGGDPERH